MSLIDRAKAKAEGSDAAAYKPETPGEGVEGVVLSKSYQESDYQAGVMIPTLVLQDSSGEKHRVIGFRTVLRNEIEETNPEEGDSVGVVYLGTQPLKTGKFKGKPTHVYRVVVEKAGTPADTPPF